MISWWQCCCQAPSIALINRRHKSPNYCYFVVYATAGVCSSFEQEHKTAALANMLGSTCRQQQWLAQAFVLQCLSHLKYKFKFVLVHEINPRRLSRGMAPLIFNSAIDRCEWLISRPPFTPLAITGGLAVLVNIKVFCLQGNETPGPSPRSWALYWLSYHGSCLSQFSHHVSLRSAVRCKLGLLFRAENLYEISERQAKLQLGTGRLVLANVGGRTKELFSSHPVTRQSVNHGITSTKAILRHTQFNTVVPLCLVTVSNTVPIYLTSNVENPSNKLELSDPVSLNGT